MPAPHQDIFDFGYVLYSVNIDIYVKQFLFGVIKLLDIQVRPSYFPFLRPVGPTRKRLDNRIGSALGPAF
jgi:hypothetical protein